jgi:site-specific recombinase XerD
VCIQLLANKFYDYSLYIRGHSKATIKRYKYVINLYCTYSQITDIADVTHENVKALFYYGRTERGWKANTFIVFYKSLSVFFKWCIKEKLISGNPLEDIEKPKLEQRIPKKLDRHEAMRLLEIVYNYPYEYKYLRYRNHALFATFIFAGLRLNELLKLRFIDVDLENLTIFVSQGKGRKDRIMPISFTLAKTLKRYLQERKRLNKTCPEFFTSLRENCGFTENGLKHLVCKLRKSSGLDFTVHRLRHTFATLMLEGGCDIYSLSRMMGHSDIKTTTIYLSASAEHLRSQITKHPLNDAVI